jgi:hypothetical protein
MKGLFFAFFFALIILLASAVYSQDMPKECQFITNDFNKRIAIDITTYDGKRIHEYCSFIFTIYDTLFVMQKTGDKKIICLKNIKSLQIAINDSLYCQPYGTTKYMNEIRDEYIDDE